MEIEFFLPQGPHPTEMEGLTELRRALPPAWKGFANFVMRQPGRRGQDREIDAVLITHDRIILADLKHLRGKLENRGGFWHRGQDFLGVSPAHKIRENAKVLASLIQKELTQLKGVPPIESVVILTNPTVDPSGLDQVERDRTLKLSEFLRITDPRYYGQVFTTRSKFDTSAPLCTGGSLSLLHKFFRNGRLFEPRRAKYHGFIPTGPAEFKHKLFSEFACHEADNPNYTGLLRLWNFSVEEEFLVEEVRRPVAERERVVLGYLRKHDPSFYDNYLLRSVAHDSEFSLRYSELFDRMPDLERLTRFAGAITDLTVERRIELARLFLDRVASLHRARVAHRDIDRHSVWIDESRSKVVLSGFGASQFPERSSIGGARSKLLAGGHRVPEDVGRVQTGTGFQHDVYLSGALVWALISGSRLPTDGKVPVWPAKGASTNDVPPEFEAWFERCLQLEPKARFNDGVEAADEFAEIARKGQKISLERQLERYRRDVDPISDYPPVEWRKQKPIRVYRSSRENKELFVKSWPERLLGERRKSAARLIEFFARAETLQLSSAGWAPRLDLACLCADGLLLVQEWIPGSSLAETDTASWSADTLRAFLSRLVYAIDELHESGLAHSDLSPNNIMLRKAEAQVEPVLVDLVDFSLDPQGKATPAYCPPQDNDMRVRDRFAVCEIARELAGRTDAETAAPILAGIEKCGRGDTPWLTLKPLRDALSPQAPQEQPELVTLTVEMRRTPFEGKMLPDNGRFHVIRSRKKNTIEIFGFDQRIIVEIDPQDGKPRIAEGRRVNSWDLNWAQGVALFAVEGTIEVRRAQRTTFSGFDTLLRKLKTYPAFSAEPPIGSDQSPPAQEPTASAPAAAHEVQFPVARFWSETITVEEEIQPEINLVAPPKHDFDDGTLTLECEDGLSEVGPTDGQSVVVTWNGIRVGDLDVARSRGATIVIRNARNVPGLKQSAVLKLQSNEDLESFRRRSRAVERILRRRSQIENLIDYFDPQTELMPRDMEQPVKDDQLARYGLNDDQKKAFKDLWISGPLGLLQGPPGTGKTLFIAAFAHYALSKGGMKSVLVLSQSHEAVNTAAERILKISSELGGPVDMLRVGDHEKISPAIRTFHSRAIQDRYRELFRASLKERAAAPSRRLGLDRDYVKDSLENEAVFGSLARQIDLCESDTNSGDVDVSAAAKQRLDGLRIAWSSLLREYGIDERQGNPRETLEEIRDDIASRHSVFDLDARHRLIKLHALGREWISVLGTRSRNLEEFLARSRNLICGTCVGIGRRGLQIERNAFDLVIIDEAARCNPGELAVGMQSGRRILLVGDHRQLPPLFGHELLRAVAERLGIKSRKQLTQSDFERAFDSRYGKVVQQVLKKQYRMAPKIGSLVAETFYPGQNLDNARGPPPGYYGELPRPLDDELTWIDTGHSRTHRRETDVGKSFMNRREGAAILSLLRTIGRHDRFLAAAKKDLKEGDHLIGVICMYAPQADHIEELILQSDLHSEFKALVKVGSVDSYQGKENAIVVVSLVRSNPEFNMGFIRTANRVNVALSRAMERLIIVGSARMFGADGNPLQPVVRHLRSAGRIFGDGMSTPGAGRDRRHQHHRS
jgi:serine/threonine protein kinase/DNA polymerase III delta prime subunit